MIGRTLDAILSPLQIIGRECRSEGVDSIFLYLIDAMRSIVLPVVKCSYGVKKQGDEEKVNLSVNEQNIWSIYSPTDWKLKRDCAKVFEMRRKVEIGETFKIQGTAYTGFGNFDKDFIVERISDNAVAYRDHLISSSEDELIRNKDRGYIPVLYEGVIW